MRKLLPAFLLLICSIPFSSSAQKYLTNRQVNTYSVGDVFETRACTDYCMSTPPNYVLTKILAKWYTLTPDTTYYYKQWVQSFTSPSCMTCTGTYSSAIDTLKVDKLDSAASQFAYLNNCSCSKLKDSIYVDSTTYCRPLWVWIRWPDTACTNTCFEPDQQSSELIEGWGVGYIYGGNNTVPVTWNLNLIYYKRGADSCGNEYLMGIDELKANALGVKIYPNPNHGAFRLKITNYELKIADRVEIYNMLGEKIYSALTPALSQMGEGVKVDISNHPAGIYFYRLVAADGKQVATGKFIIE